MAKNCIIIPCHRVVEANGSLTGYGGGMKSKIKLLEIEKNDMSKFSWNSNKKGPDISRGLFINRTAGNTQSCPQHCTRHSTWQ